MNFRIEFGYKKYIYIYLPIDGTSTGLSELLTD